MSDVSHVYSRTEVACSSCGEMTHYFAAMPSGDRDKLVCHRCTEGPPLSEFGKEVMREVASDE